MPTIPAERVEDTSPLVRIIDDQPAVREAVADLLASVGLQSRSFSSAVDFLNHDDPALHGCVVLDVRMPGMSGLDLLVELNARHHALPVVFITGHGDIAMAVRAMKAGAIDILAKPFDDQQLIDAVNSAAREDLARRARATSLARVKDRFALLSDGERRVVDLIVQGLQTKQISAALKISEITVKVRRARVMRKLEVQSTPALVRIYDQAT